MEHHTFSDTSEHAVDRQFQAVKRKLILHGQDERAARLQYLLDELDKRKGAFKQVGLSETSKCALQLLLCLSLNPTGLTAYEEGGLVGRVNYGIGGVHDNLPSQKIYESKEDMERRRQEHNEALIKELQESEEMR